jgi:hypothetical protein
LRQGDRIIDALPSRGTVTGKNAPNRTLPSNSPYSQADYDAYVQRKVDAGETPRSPEDYISARQHWDKGGAAHQAAVDVEVDTLRTTYGPDAGIVQNRSVNSADGCTTCRPDIMVYDPNNGTLHVVEVKTGSANLTPNQRHVYPEIADGSASMNASQLRSLGLPERYAGQPLSNIPNLNIVVEEVRR